MRPFRSSSGSSSSRSPARTWTGVFMVRVGRAADALRARRYPPDPAGLSADRLLEAISRRTHQMTGEQYLCFLDELEPALAQAGIKRLRRERARRTPGQDSRPVVRRGDLRHPHTPMAVSGPGDSPSSSTRRSTSCVQLRRPTGRAIRAFAVIPFGRSTTRFITLPSTAATSTSCSKTSSPGTSSGFSPACRSSSAFRSASPRNGRPEPAGRRRVGPALGDGGGSDGPQVSDLRASRSGGRDLDDGRSSSCSRPSKSPGDDVYQAPRSPRPRRLHAAHRAAGLRRPALRAVAPPAFFR